MLLSFALMATLQTPQLKSGDVLDRSRTFTPTVYEMPAGSDLKTPALIIRGKNIVLDFGGTTLRGSDVDANPDTRSGLAVLVDGGENITIKNLNVHGYRVALLAIGTKGLHVTNCDFSYNWKQHLKSTIEAEDESDWMSFHHNEKDEWIYGNGEDPGFGGGGIYLKGCDGFEVDHVVNTGSQCGLMMTRSNHGKVWNNKFTFLSAIGIGMYRSSDNTIMHNDLDFCVRGYSHGVYSRGQDSSGILIYEQSNRNTFAYNSATHGGDGFFLWAGQTTMDTGEGGCNDNLVFGNDFSHSPANGIEATFSRNTFARNRLVDCWHGVWGGYSYDSKIIGNMFDLNGQAIAIEHGQKNEIKDNYFWDNDEGMYLWMNSTQAADWGYPKHHDTKSHGYQITGNTMIGTRGPVLRLKDTADVFFAKNTALGNRHVITVEGDNANLKTSSNMIDGFIEPLPKELFPNSTVANTQPIPPDVKHMSLRGDAQKTSEPIQGYPLLYVNPWLGTKYSPTGETPPSKNDNILNATKALAPKPLKGGMNPWKTPDFTGRMYILVDQWGPYDFKSPLLWPRPATEESTHLLASPGEDLAQYRVLEVLGPAGKWRVKDKTGIEAICAENGSVPGRIVIRLPKSAVALYKLNLEYTGEEIVTPFGRRIPAGTAYAFGSSGFSAPISWNVKWYRWTEASDPRTHEAEFKAVLAGSPIATDQPKRLEYAGASFVKGLPADHYATVAEGEVELPQGEYTLKLTTDDGARLWFDDELVVKDAWKYQGPTTYTASVTAGVGKHRIRVEHFQIDGYAALKLELKPKA